MSESVGLRPGVSLSVGLGRPWVLQGLGWGLRGLSWGSCSQSCAWGGASGVLLGGRRESLWPSRGRSVLGGSPWTPVSFVGQVSLCGRGSGVQ